MLIRKFLIVTTLFFLHNIATTQNIGIGTFAPKTKLQVAENGIVLFGADTTGTGKKMMWISDLAAFRSGQLSYGTYWDRDSVGVGSFATGFNTKAKGLYSSAFGIFSSTSGEAAVAAGYLTKASGQYAMAWGSNSLANDVLSTAWGLGSSATGSGATAWGNITLASGVFSTAWGGDNLASGTYAVVWGDGNTSSGESTTAWGANSTASNFGATAFGVATFATGEFSTAWGNGALATGITSTAWGQQTAASGLLSVAWGSNTTASSSYSTAWGIGSSATASYSTAWGFSSIAAGKGATSMGFATKAEAYYCTAIGRYNNGGGDPNTWNSEDPLFEIGIGTAFNARKNALTILKDGKHGIITPEPKANLHVKDDGTTDNPTTIAILESSISKRPLLQFSETSSGNPSSGMSIEYDGRENGDNNKLNFNNSSGNPIVTFENSGQVGIGLSNPTFILHIPADLGSARAKSWTTYSDKRIKSNFSTLTYGLAEILALQPMNYRQHSASFKASNLEVDLEFETTVGFIAQEVYEIIPEAVMKPENENEQLWGMDYEKLIPVLVKGIQEQQEEIEFLKKEIIALKEKQHTTAVEAEK